MSRTRRDFSTISYFLSIAVIASRIKDSKHFYEDQDEENHETKSSNRGEDHGQPRGNEGDSTQDAKFPRFNDLPVEIWSMIWGIAASIPQIVHLDHPQLAYYSCWRVRSDRAIDDFGEDGMLPAFFDNQCEIDDDQFDRLVVIDAVRPERSLSAFRTLCPISFMLLACYESFAVASRVYIRAFGNLGVFLEVWANFESNFIYLDWGNEVSGWRYDIEDICNEYLQRIRYIVLFDSIGFIARSGYDCCKERLAEILVNFHISRLLFSAASLLSTRQRRRVI